MWLWSHNKMTLYYRVQGDRSSDCRASTNKARGEPPSSWCGLQTYGGGGLALLPAADNSSLLKLRVILPGPAGGYKVTAEQEDGGGNLTIRVLHKNEKNSLWLALGLCY